MMFLALKSKVILSNLKCGKINMTSFSHDMIKKLKLKENRENEWIDLKWRLKK